MEKKDNEGQRLTRVSNMTGEVGGVDACQVSSRQGNKAREVRLVLGKVIRQGKLIAFAYSPRTY